jgi:hypothetical protein
MIPNFLKVVITGANAIGNPYGTTPPPDAGLAGVQANGMDICQFMYDAGWTDAKELVEGAATFFGESDWYTMAFHHNRDPQSGKVISTDWGACQLNDVAHPEFFPGGDPNPIAFDLEKAIAAARQIYVANGNSFSPWVANTSGVWLNDGYTRRACLAVMNFLSRDLVNEAKTNPGPDTTPPKTLVPMISVQELQKIYPQ